MITRLRHYGASNATTVWVTPILKGLTTFKWKEVLWYSFGVNRVISRTEYVKQEVKRFVHPEDPHVTDVDAIVAILDGDI